MGNELLPQFFYQFGLPHIGPSRMVDHVLDLIQDLQKTEFQFCAWVFIRTINMAERTGLGDKEDKKDRCLACTKFWSKINRYKDLKQCMFQTMKKAYDSRFSNQFVWFCLDLNLPKQQLKKILNLVDPSEALTRGRTFKTVREIRREMRKKAKQRKAKEIEE